MVIMEVCMNKDYCHVEHPIEPVYDDRSQILILGSFPSVKSRQQEFFYGHPQNRFWKVVSGVLKSSVPVTIEEKKEMLHEHHIALWDVIASCDIVGSSDSSIKNVVSNDLSKILEKADIKNIYANGGKAYELYRRYTMDKTGRSIIKLPSTSPANAAWNIERLINAWNVIRNELR